MAITTKPLNKSLEEYGRGITGGLLFSLPMLYTMELWWTGFIADPLRLLLYFIIGLSLLLVYNHYVGLRNDHTFREGLLESIEEMGVGMLLTMFILWLTGRITLDMSIHEVSGKIIVEAVTVAIGISVGKTQLGGKEDTNDEQEESEHPENKKEKRTREAHLIRAINLALCGAILVASNVAPTEEVMVIALESGVLKILGIALVSIVIGGAILYQINFKGSKEWIVEPNNHFDIIAGTTTMYSVALISSAFMLWFFGRFEEVSLYTMLAQTVVLGFPATLGASAGRLLIQP